MTNNEAILFKYRDGIATLTLNRPSVHNAFNDQMILQLSKQLQHCAQDSRIRVVLLQANGRNFCAGADLHWMKSMVDYSIAENEADALRLAELLKILAELPKPIIALVQGRVMGGGLGIIACCDVVIAKQDAKFCFSEVKLGLIPATIAPYILRSIGFSATRRYFQTAELFDANEARRLGLIHEIIDEQNFTQYGQHLAKHMLHNGPQAMTTAKQLINQLTAIDANTMHSTATLLAEIRTSQEGQEGLTAFFEKRKANW